MDPRDVNIVGVDPAAAKVIGGYLAVLESHLPVGRRVRAEIRNEIADGLASAVQQHTDGGVSPATAARDAVAEFGDPRLLAAAFTRQLGPATAHRVGLGLVASGPLVGLTWVAAYATSGLGLPAQVAGVLSSLPQLPLILAVTVPAAIVAATGAGWAARHLTLPPRLVTNAALVATIGCVAGDLSLLTAAILSHRMTTIGSGGVIVVAVAASVARLSAAGWAGHRVARLHAASN